MPPNVCSVNKITGSARGLPDESGRVPLFYVNGQLMARECDVAGTLDAARTS